MGIIEEILKPISSYLMSFDRNTTKGWYELKIGLPIKWVFDDGDVIECDVLEETKIGRVLKVFPSPVSEDDVPASIDDLVEFAQIIIKTNENIALKEKEFSDRMNEVKVSLEKEAKKFYTELDELKVNSFKTMTDELNSEGSEVEESSDRVKREDVEVVEMSMEVDDGDVTIKPKKVEKVKEETNKE